MDCDFLSLTQCVLPQIDEVGEVQGIVEITGVQIETPGIVDISDKGVGTKVQGTVVRLQKKTFHLSKSHPHHQVAPIAPVPSKGSGVSL